MKVLVKIFSVLVVVAAFSSCGEKEKQVRVPTLRCFLERRGAALEKIAATPSDQLEVVKLEVSTTAEQRAGCRRLRIRDHQIISDSGYDYAGYSLGPGSQPSIVTSLASDLVDSYLSVASLRGVQIDSLGVSITWLPDTVELAEPIIYPHNLSYTVFIDSPADDEELEEIRLLAEQESSVYQLFTKSHAISHEIDYAQTPKNLTPEAPYQPGLREFLKYKRIAVLYKEEQEKQKSQVGKASDVGLDELHAEVDPVSGARKIHIRNFNFIHDNQAILAGQDLGPSSVEHALGVISTCMTHITECQAAKHSVVLDSLAVKVTADYDYRAGREGFEDVPNYPYNINLTWRVRTPETYEAAEKLLLLVESVCPVYNLILNEQTIPGRIVRDDPAKYRKHPQHWYEYKL